MPRSGTQAKAKTSASNGVRPRRLSRPKARSSITNGTSILPNVDHRTLWVRRFKDLLALHTADLGSEENVSSAEASILRRACCLMVELERREQIFAQKGEASDQQLAVYQMTSNSLRRLLESLGLQRRQKQVGMTLGQVLRSGFEQPQRDAP